MMLALNSGINSDQNSPNFLYKKKSMQAVYSMNDKKYINEREVCIS